MNTNFDYCYRGIDPNGKLLMTSQLAESLKSHYAKYNIVMTPEFRSDLEEAIGARGRGFAMDAMPALDAEPPDDAQRRARYDALESMYRACLGQPNGRVPFLPHPDLNDTTEAARLTLENGRRDLGLGDETPFESEMHSLARFKRAHAADQWTARQTKYYFDLETAYERARKGTN